jgi:hypothetical protein
MSLSRVKSRCRVRSKAKGVDYEAHRGPVQSGDNKFWKASEIGAQASAKVVESTLPNDLSSKSPYPASSPQPKHLSEYRPPLDTSPRLLSPVSSAYTEQVRQRENRENLYKNTSC